MSTFRELHRSGCFVMPNPWDPGSAVQLAALGFPALATSSAGYAFTRGLPDTPQALGLDDVLGHVREIVSATPLPVSADFQAGYAADSRGVELSVRRCIETGVAGLSIEDATGDRTSPLFDVAEASERVSSARAAIEASGRDVVLTARAECHLVGHPDPLAESIRRLRAYADAGADVLYAPGLSDARAIREVVDAVAPKPVNVLVGRDMRLSVSELGALGVRRVSVGSALARVAWTAFRRAAKSLAENGTFDDFAALVGTGELSALFEEACRPANARK
jgi:2-methylisocitrate lyase-like PEP mutase family enzyme